MEIKKVLIANRGEIALRIQRAAREMNIKTVAVYSRFDAASKFVKAADEAFPLRGTEVAETYLDIAQILELARRAKADAIHPGYGFLSENPSFAQACSQAKIKFIGPRPEVLQKLGNKVAAKQLAEQVGVPVIPGFASELPKGKKLQNIAEQIGFPVLVKAAAGGGGKGMRVVHDSKSLEEAVSSAAREAQAYFKDERVFFEKYIPNPRHIEVQILGDEAGNILHLFERECSLQRRHQKMMEESPSPSIEPKVRESICAAAIKLAKAAKYSSAGTMEFLVDPNDQFYFLEVNALLQVEHPVTESVTGIDLVKEQFKIAAGQPLAFTQNDIQQRGCAMECRLYAEDPENNFLPSEGRIGVLRQTQGPGIRVDAALEEGKEIASLYDPMLGKLIVSGDDRKEVLQKMKTLLKEFTLLGVRHNLDFMRFLLETPPVSQGRYHTHTVQEFLGDYLQSRKFPEGFPVAAWVVGAMTQRSAMPSPEVLEDIPPLKSLRGFRNA